MQMRLLAILIASAAAVSAQSPLTTTFASNNGQSGNMFDVVATNAAGVTIKNFAVNIDAGMWDLEVWTLPSGTPYLPDVNNAGAWTLLASTSGVTGAGLNLPTLLPICVDTFIPTATTQAFYVTVTNGTSMNYTNGTTTGALYASNADLEFYEGSGLAYPFSANFNPRIWNGTISYDVGNTSGSGCGFATTESIGDGCVADLASVYQLTTLDAFALANTMTGIDYINTGGGHLVTMAAGILGLTNPSLPLSVLGFPASCTLDAQADVLVGPAVVSGSRSNASQELGTRRRSRPARRPTRRCSPSESRLRVVTKLHATITNRPGPWPGATTMP